MKIRTTAEEEGGVVIKERGEGSRMSLREGTGESMRASRLKRKLA